MAEAFQPQVEQQGLVASSPAQPPSVPQPVGPNSYVTDLNDDSVRRFEFEKYAGRTNTTDRIYLIRPKHIVKVRRHYHDKLNYVLCNSKYTRQGEHELMVKEGECCKRLGKQSLTFATLVIRYITEKTGQLIVNPFPMPELRLWRFGVDKYLQLKGINKEWPLENHDLMIVCSDEKYQKMTINAQRQAIYQLPNFPAETKRQFEEWAELSLPKIPREMGKEMSDEEILKELGAAGPAPASMNVNDQPIGDFSALISGAQK
jgi:hypothetical protein